MFDNYVTDVKKNSNGDYDIYRSDIGDGKKVWKTIVLKDLRNKIAALEAKDAPTRTETEQIQRDIADAQANLAELKREHGAKIAGLDNAVGIIERDINELQGNLDRVEGLTLGQITTDGKGVFTFTRKNGNTVTGTIDTSGNITGITPNDNGTFTLHHVNGTQTVVSPAKVQITEANEGTPEHTVTITVPGGNSVTFNVFDKVITDVKWNEKAGVYEIYRSDIGGGKQVWKTIDLSSLRDRIAALEAKQSPTAQEFDALRRDIAEYKKLIATELTNVRGDISRLDRELTDVATRVTSLESRVTTLEADRDALAKCHSAATLAVIPAVGITMIALASQINIPGIAQANVNLQKQLGIYRPELAANANIPGNVAQIAPVIAGIAGLIGAIAYAANACSDYRNTQAMQNTPLGKLSAGLGSSNTQ